MVYKIIPQLNKYKIKRIVYSTYQAVSGAGVAGMEELYRQFQTVDSKYTVIP